ncbi:MAG: N-acetylgalactosamine-N,N'-diacetylbacillosaminyl -diphospho-undecaprenol 4-alpha-N-acetylgalactosaminyltransferase [Nitrospinaceae bacterium]|nr:MAG: N-acetylgalactosamine-N,N'-diacetylbacillosaminyl -diphospho-undecaprenol 4-alpha-N-acetylgalactosaminyltransferase [Nitrospinaceae bacterium]
MVRKKLLLIIPQLSRGGAERVITYIASFLSQEKYEISLILYEKKGGFLDQLPKNVRIFDFKKQAPWDFIKLICLTRKVVKEAEPDVVLSFLFFSNIITGLSVVFLKRKFRLIFSERNYLPEYLRKIRFGWIKKWLTIFSYRRADLIVPNSKVSGAALEKVFNVPAEKIRTIYNPIDLESVISRSQEDVTHPFFAGGHQVIIGVGRLEEQKRFDRLLRAFAVVRKKNENARLVVLGEGKLRNKLSEWVSQQNLNPSVEFVGSQENPYAWISKAELFVLSSDFEGFPNVLLEAMACETPVVSTDCLSGPSEIITHGENGMLIPTQNESALAEAIHELLNQKELRHKFSKEGRKRVEQFKMQEILPQYEALFQ